MIRKLVAIVVPIIVFAIAAPTFVSSVTKLQEIDKEKQDSEPTFIAMFEQVLDHCTSSGGARDPHCRDEVQSVMQQCSFYNNPAICSDSRIQQILHS